LASDRQVNYQDGYEQKGKCACKSRELPNKKGFIGIAGLINVNDVIVLDAIITQLHSVQNVSIQDCTTAIDYVLNLNLGSISDWHCIFMISLATKDIIENHTYIRTPHLKTLFPPHIIAHQINAIYLKDLNEAWGSFDYNTLWYSEINKYAAKGQSWTIHADFNYNYMHLFHGLPLEDPDQWYIFTKPYTLLYFEFLNRGWSYQNFSAITDIQWIEILQSMYINAKRTYTELYKNDYDRSKPCSSIGECNHIIKLEQSNHMITVILAEDPC